MSHGDEALELPPGFELMAKTHHAVAAFKTPTKKWCGAVPSRSASHAAGHGDSARISFSRSAARSPLGRRSTSSNQPLSRSRNRWATGRAICALSGGVDSSVAAVLVDRAMRDAKGKSRLTCVFVNNGVLRKNEFEKVQKTSARQTRTAPGCGRCDGPLSEQAGRRHRSGEEAQDHRQRIHRGVREGSAAH